jgi:tetratricopeptide (TPR) repeat protein
MSGTIVGMVALLLIVLYMWGTQALRRQRFARYWKAGHEAAQRKDWESAERAFRKSVKLLPVAGMVHRVLGRVLVERGNLAEAEEHLRLGASLEPRNPDGHMDLGMFFALHAPERVDDAVTAFESAAASAPQLRDFFRDDPRLDNLRGNERFQRLLL